jgi:hypothetical protein
MADRLRKILASIRGIQLSRSDHDASLAVLVIEIGPGSQRRNKTAAFSPVL